MRGQWMRLWVVFFVGLGLGVRAESSPREQVWGQVRLWGGLPVAGAQVVLFDLADLRRGAVAQATTDASGQFALPLAGRPNGVVLGQNYPNPFNPSTVIPYELSSSSWVRLEVFNLLGQRLALLVDGEQDAGAYRVHWDGTDGAGRAAAAGVYLYRLTVGESSQTGRMVLVDGQAGVPLGGSGVEVVPSLGAGGSYGLVVFGDGIVAYADAAFEMASGMGPVEVVVEAVGEEPRGKGTATEILGDVNNDGQVDLGDVLLVMMYSLDPSINIPNIARGDMNNDGRVELIDAYLIITNILNLSDPSLLDPSGNASSEQRQLTFDGNSLEPAWSPDGHEIVFTKDDGTYVDVYVMDSEGNILRQLTTDGNSSDPSWRSDGERIYYVSDGDIYSVRPDGTNKQLMVSDSRNPSMRYGVSTGGGLGSIATYYYYLAVSYDGVIWLKLDSYYLNIGDSHWYVLTSADDSKYDYQPELNPTSSFLETSTDLHWWDIVFTRRSIITDGDDTWNIHVVDQDGNETQLTFDDNSWGPAWSPTGRYIAFASDTNTGWDIYVMAANGQNRRQLTFDGNAYQPSWHPNERRIAFTSQKNIYTVQFSPDQR